MANIAEFDILIIGAGPIGLACGIEATKAGLNYVIIDKGCLVNSIYNYPLNMTFFSTSEKLEIGNIPFISHGNKPVRSEALEYYRRVSTHWSLNIRLFESIECVESTSQGYLVKTQKETLLTKSIVVATGFFDLPNLTGVPGESLPKVHHYYKEPHPYFGKKIVVIGAANSAVDVALECYRKNAFVTMVIKSSHISDRVKYWVKPDIENRINENSILAHFNSTVAYIKENEVGINTPQGLITIENDFVLSMTGYLPDFSFLEKLGIEISGEISRIPRYNPDTMETNIKQIYLAGVICGGTNTHKWFIENSRVHAEIIVKDLVSKLQAS